MFSARHETAWQTARDLEREDARLRAPGPLKDLFAPSLGDGSQDDKEILEGAARTKADAFAGRIFPIAPLYVTSVCSESCLYCNFRGGNKGVGVERRRLTLEEVAREAGFLVEEKGLRVLELVYSSDPMIRADAMCRHVEVLKGVLDRKGGGMVALNAESLDEDEYRRLRDAGLDLCLLWQETYDRERYRDLHPGRTKKARFEYRMDSYERMLLAGVPHIGMGVLSGLGDWRKDWAMLIQHEIYLAEECGHGPDVLGLPRLKPAPGAPLYHTPFIPTDEEFLALVGLHNLNFPRCLPFVSTRESWELCTTLARGGGCLFTLNCSTTPGGYSLPRQGCQFPVNSYDAPEFVPRLKELGFRPEFSWNFASAGGIQPVSTR